MNKTELENLVERGFSQREIGIYFNKSKTSIRHWLNKYNIKTKNIKIGDIGFHQSGKYIERKIGTSIKNICNNLDFILEIQKLYNEDRTWIEVAFLLKISRATIGRLIKKGILISRKEMPLRIKEKHKISILKWLNEHPEQHVWKTRRNQSKPCEFVKDFLRNKNINFIEEFTPYIQNRNFAIDIAFPDKLIGIEINGSFHYEKTGELKPYYKQREDVLESGGWIIYQIPTKVCYNLENLNNLIDSILNSSVKIEFDYFAYRKKPKQKIVKNRHNLCNCGKSKLINSKLCVFCNSSLPKPNKHKIIHPSKECLEKLVKEKPMTQIGKFFGVSDNSIRKWCKKYEINFKKSA